MCQLKKLKELRKAIGEALKLNALCMGHLDGDPVLPRDDNNDLVHKDISDARWKVIDIIKELEEQYE